MTESLSGQISLWKFNDYNSLRDESGKPMDQGRSATREPDDMGIKGGMLVMTPGFSGSGEIELWRFGIDGIYRGRVSGNSASGTYTYNPLNKATGLSDHFKGTWKATIKRSPTPIYSQ